jgi:hypothetical protein
VIMNTLSNLLFQVDFVFLAAMLDDPVIDPYFEASGFATPVHTPHSTPVTCSDMEYLDSCFDIVITQFLLCNFDMGRERTLKRSCLTVFSC